MASPNSRRRFLASAAGGLLAAPAWARMLPGADPAAAERDAAARLARPLPRQVAWQDFELGLVFHFDMPVYAPGGWNWVRKTFDPALYRPAKLDTDQWIDAARALGARYAIFTATHFGGFLQWQSDLYPYGVKQSPWRGGRGDVFRDFVESCRRARIAPGVYLSCHRNAYWKVDHHRVDWGRGGPGQKAFARVCEKMVEELCTRYGPLCEIWFDAGLLAPSEGGPDVVPIVDKHQPYCVFYHSPQRREHRWIGNEQGVAGYPCWSTMPDARTAEAAHRGTMRDAKKLLAHGDPQGKLWSPAMVDVPIRNHAWFWRPGEDAKVFPLASLVSMVYTSVGRNGNLILGATPDRDGLVPEADRRRYAELGAEIRRRFAKPLAETRGRGDTVELALPRPARVDHAILMEDIAEGERVRKYAVEGLVPGGVWQKLCEGSSIGHKRIERFAPADVAKVRFRALESVGQPRLGKLAVYAVG